MASLWGGDEDEDAPPPLGSLKDQLEAAQLARARAAGDTATGLAQAEELRTATVCVIQTEGKVAGALHPAGKPAQPAIKRGFLDAKPKPKSKPPQPAAAQVSNAMPVLHAKVGAPGTKQIPDFLRVQPDEAELKYKEVRDKLVDALKPTQETVAQIASDPGLVAGFDDPDVMAAVNEIAANPTAFKKHAHNKKVVAFYSAMGKVMGQRLEGMQPQQLIDDTAAGAVTGSRGK